MGPYLPGKSNVTQHKIRKFKIFKSPPPKEETTDDSLGLGPDLQFITMRLPDAIFKTFENKLFSSALIPLSKYYGIKLVHIYVIFTILWTLLMILIVRIFPSGLGIIFFLFLTFTSFTQSTGILLFFYCLFNLVRIMFSQKGITYTNLQSTPYANFSNQKWYTQDVTGLLMLVLITVTIGIYYNIFNSELMLCVVAVMVIMLLSKSFPTGGQNSTGNVIIIILVLLMVIFFGTGLGPALKTVASDAYAGYRHSRQMRDEGPNPTTPAAPPEAQPNVLDDIMLAFGSWRDPMWTESFFGYSILDFFSMVRFLMGTTFIYAMVIGDLMGPAMAVKEQGEITNKVKDPRPDGVMPILKTKWLVTVVSGTIFYVFTQNYLAIILCILSFGLAVAWYLVVEKMYWTGRGQLASCHIGRNDMVIIKGDGPATCRKFLLQGVVAFACLSMTYIHTSLRLIVFTLVWLVPDERALSLLAMLTTQCHWYLPGIFSWREDTVTGDYITRVVAANAKDDPVGSNSKNIITDLIEKVRSGSPPISPQLPIFYDSTRFKASRYRHRYTD